MKIYATSSEQHGIVRSQDNEIIFCNEKKFDKKVCLINTDFAKIIRKLQECEKSTSVLNIKVYATSSKEQAIVRKQDNEIIYCTAPEFDKKICVANKYYKKIIKKLQQCARR